MDKYITTPQNLKKTIKKYGVAIIKNVLDNDEIDKMNKGIWSYLEHVTQNFDIPIKKKNEKTWKEFYNLYPKHSMLLQQWGIGHAQYIWNLRTNKKIVDIFSILWNKKKEYLLTSFDGASFGLPHEITNRGYYKGNDWLHVDQSYTRNNLECVQSWVTGYDVNEKDATLVFMEKSNKYHEDFKKHFSIKNKSDWYKLNKEEILFYQNKGCKINKIKCKAGDMVFWDSRTVHSGIEAMYNRNKINFRHVVYICMTPRSLATKSALIKKQKAFNDKRTTNHWPHKPKLFPTKARTYGKQQPDVVDVDDVVISRLGKKYAGF